MFPAIFKSYFLWEDGGFSSASDGINTLGWRTVTKSILVALSHGRKKGIAFIFNSINLVDFRVTQGRALDDSANAADNVC